MFEQQKLDLSQFSDQEILQFIKQNPELKREYDKFMINQQKNQPNLQPKSKPLTDKEYLKLKDIKEYLDPEGGMMIEPTPQFAIKSFDKKTNEKVFLNILAHSVIDEPEQKQLVDYQNQNGIRVPMSVGNIKEDHDAKGELCKVIDIVINPNVAENIKKDKNVREFFCSLIQTYLIEKYKLDVKDEFIFPKLKYKGSSIQYQRVKGKKPPKIEILKEENDEKNTNSQQDEIKNSKEKQEKFEDDIFDQMNKLPQQALQPEWEIYIIYDDNSVIEYDGDFDISKIKQIKIELHLPLIVTGKGINLQVGPELFYMRNGRIYEIFLRFPFNIDPTTAKAHFTLEKRILNIFASPEKLYQVSKENQQTKIDNLTSQTITLPQKITLESNLLYDIV